MRSTQEHFQNEKDALEQAGALAKQIGLLEIELKDNQPLLNQLQMLKTNLQNSREYLLSKDHQIAFVGSIGVGKTTAICGILELVDENGKTALSASSGRTTLCEVEIRRGKETRILIAPCSAAEVDSHLRDFADVLKMRSEGQAAADDSEAVALSSEVERCLRNMVGLPTRTRTQNGELQRTDEAMDLYKRLIDPAVFLEELRKRIKLDQRSTMELCSEGEDAVKWIKVQFDQINHGKNEAVPMPQRIVIEVAELAFGGPELNVSIIDTKGLDGNVERDDIDRQFRNNRAVCVVCSKFNDAPEQSVQDLLKHLKESGLVEQITEQTQLLILDRNDEAENVMSEEGSVASAEEGRLIRSNQVEDTLRSRLQLSDDRFPEIHFFDARENDSESTRHALLAGVLQLRQERASQVIEIAAAVVEIADHREKAQARAAFEIVSGAVHSWALISRTRLASIHQIYKSLVDDMTTREVYASSIRAAVNRNGSWGNFDFYYKLAVASRKKAVTSFGDAVAEIRLVLANLERQQDLGPAHPFIRQLLHAVNERMEKLYAAAAVLGRNAYEGTMKGDDPFWSNQQRQWGQGPGYKDRIAQGTEGWFQHHDPAARESQIHQQVMQDWSELVTQVESLLVEKAC